MDPIMGIVGALIISRWSYGLLVDTSKVLLDRDVNAEAVEEIRSIIESDSDNRVTDLHIWRVGSHHLSAIVSVVTHYPKPPDHYKQLLAGYDEMAHVTVEVNQCEGDPCLTKPEPVSG
jgi:Co/Zn/Cd efflux system component